MQRQREGKYFSTKKINFAFHIVHSTPLKLFTLVVNSFFYLILIIITYYYYYYYYNYYKIVINIRRPLISTTFRHLFSITFQSQLIDSKLIFEIMNEITS